MQRTQPPNQRLVSDSKQGITLKVEEYDYVNKTSTKKGFFQEDVSTRWGYRHQQSLVLFFCVTVSYSIRASMAVALVAMTVNNFQTTYTDLNRTELVTDRITLDKVALNINDEESQVKGVLGALLLYPPYPKFQWNKKTQDTILSSFYWGYMVLQIPAGQLAHKFGAKRLLTGAMIVNSIVSFSTPWAAFYGGWLLTVICRVMMGLSQSFVLPSLHTIFGKWTPLEERGRLTAFAHGGLAVGPVLGLPMAGFLASSPLGWPGIFRVYGVLAGLVAILLWRMLADSPSKHPHISARERRYIEETMGQCTAADTVMTTEQGKEKCYKAPFMLPPVPWLHILRSRGMLAITAAHIGYTWGHILLFTEVPAFMDKVMRVNIKANGLLSALPFLMMWLANFFFSWFHDILIIRKVLSVTNSRKLANSLAYVVSAIGFLVLGYLPINIYVVESVLVLICVFKVASHVGFKVNHIDISPNFAGAMMGISNFTSNACGSLAPILAGFIITDATSLYEWRTVFCVTSGIMFFSNLLYVVLGTAERADWDRPADVRSLTREEEPMLENLAPVKMC